MNEIYSLLINIQKGACDMSKRMKPDIGTAKRKMRLFSDIPELSGPIISIAADREMSVDGCRGVGDYFDNRIVLNIGKGSVTVSGNGLRITSFTESTAVIRGRITAVEFDFGVGQNDN